MKKKYLYNNRIVDESELMDAAKQSNMDLDTYIRKAGIHTVDDNYVLDGKSYSAEAIADAAQQSKLGFDDYLKKAGLQSTFKKKVPTTSESSNGTSPSQSSGEYNIANSVPEFHVQQAPKNTFSPQEFTTAIRGLVQKQNQSVSDNTNNAALQNAQDKSQFTQKYWGMNDEQIQQKQQEEAQQKQADTEKAIENTAANFVKGKAKVGSPQYNFIKEHLAEDVKNGDAFLSYDKDGNPGLKKGIGFLESLANGWNNATKSSDEAQQFVNDMTPEQQVEYLKQKAQQNPYPQYQGTKETPMGSIGEMLGENAPFLAKAGAGYTIGATAQALAPESFGISEGVLPFAGQLITTSKDAFNNNAMEHIQRQFNDIKQSNPDISDVDAMKLANEGKYQAGTIGAVGNAAFLGVGGNPLSAEGKGVLENTIREYANTALKTGAVSGGTTAATEMVEGKSPTQIGSDFATSFAHGATLGVLLHTVAKGVETGVKLPGVISSAIKFNFKDVPMEDIDGMLKENVDANKISPEVAIKTAEDIKGYKEALDKTPDNLDPQSQASIAGLIQKKDNLQKEVQNIEAEKQSKDPVFAKQYDEKIEPIQNEIEDTKDQIKNIAETGKPFDYEKDNVTNEPLSKESEPESNISTEIKSKLKEVAHGEDADVIDYAKDKVAEAPTKLKNNLGEDLFNKVLEQTPTEKLQEGLDYLLKNNPDSEDVDVLDKIISEREKQDAAIKEYPKESLVAKEEPKYEIEKAVPLGGEEKIDFVKIGNPYVDAEINEKTGEATSGTPVYELKNPDIIKSKLEPLYEDYTSEKESGVPDSELKSLKDAISFFENFLPEKTKKQEPQQQEQNNAEPINEEPNPKPETKTENKTEEPIGDNTEVPPPNPPKEKVVEGETGEGKQTGVKHSALADISKRLGLPEPEFGSYAPLETYIKRGRILYNELKNEGGFDDFMSRLEDKVKNGDPPTPDEINVVRAYLADKEKELNAIGDSKGTNDEEYIKGLTQLNKIKNTIAKPMLTKTGESLYSSQGSEDLDTGSITAVSRAKAENEGKPLSHEDLQKTKRLVKKVNDLQAKNDDLEAKLKEALTNGVKKEGKKSIVKGGKDLADKIRSFKSKNDKLQASLVGIPVAIYDGALETIATAVENGAKAIDAVNKGIQYLKDKGYLKSKEDEDKALDHFDEIANPYHDLVKSIAGKTDNVFTPEQSEGIWDYIKETYINDHPNYHLADVIHKAAMDLGLKAEQVAHALVRDKKTKQITEDLYRTRRDINATDKMVRRWVDKKKKKNPADKALEVIGEPFRELATFAHGHALLFTHALPNLYDYRNIKTYMTLAAKEFKIVYGNEKYYQHFVAEMKNDPFYNPALMAKVGVDPDIAYDDWELANTFLKKFGIQGQKGFAVLKKMRLEVFKNLYNSLSDVEKQDKKSLEAIGQIANHWTGTANIKPSGTSTFFFFAPNLVVSKFARLTTDPMKALLTYAQMGANEVGKVVNKKPFDVSTDEKVAARIITKKSARVMAGYLSALAANQALLYLTGSNQRVNFTNPHQSDWLKFKIGNKKTFDATGGMESAARFIAALAMMPAQSKEDLKKIIMAQQMVRTL